MTIVQIRKEIFKALWTLQSGGIPDGIARTEAETTLDALVRRMDDEAPARRDVVGPKRQPDGDVIEA